MTVDQAIQKIEETVNQMPTHVGNEAVNFFKDNFRKQGWQGKQFQKWKDRKKETPKTRGKPILTQSGALKRSIQVKQKDTESVIVGTAGQIPYARIHNEGGTIHKAARSETFTRKRNRSGKNKGRFKKGINSNKQGYSFRAHTIHMPKRQFMGDSPQLRKKLDHLAVEKINETLGS